MDCPIDAITTCSLNGGSQPNNGVVPADELGKSAPRSDSAPPSGAPLATLETGQRWSMQHLARIPNDDVLRPTTQRASQSAIRVRHTLVVELIYRVIEPEEEDAGHDGWNSVQKRGGYKKLVVTKPLELYSCCARPASLILPQYVKQAPQPDRDSAKNCVCKMTFGVTIKYRGQIFSQEKSGGPAGAEMQKYK